MSYWSRLVNVFRAERVSREIDEELHAHIEDAIAAGRDPEEARKAFGPMLHRREESRDLKLAAWLDILRSDAVFGWRQLRRNKITSIAAVLSLALATGACIATFRLADAVLFRPLPVADPHRLFALEVELVNARTGNVEHSDSFEYPLFRQLRAAAKNDAELIAIGYANQIDLTYGADQNMEKAVRQYCSGWMFESLGLKPALGRLLTEADDRTPGAHPYAVLSYQYWTRRFGADPKIIGKTFRADARLYEIVGVAAEGFTGTEPGIVTEIWVPTMMNVGVIDEAGWSWFRTWVRLRPGVVSDQVREKLQASFAAYRREHVKTWGSEVPKDRIEEYLRQRLMLRPAATGVSDLQRNLRRPLTIVGAVGLLVLLIACANVANLMTAQARSRAREMALRVSIGAGRLRLAQLVLVESAIIALGSSVLGGVFAWWSAPLVADRMATKLVLPWDWRVLGFAALITLAVTCLFGLAPALWASSVKPMSALRGGEDPHGKRRLMNALLAAQVAFCFVVHFLAGMFVTTFERLSNQPTGFAVDHVLTLETVTVKAQPPVYWEQEVEHLRTVRGVEAAGLCGWALMSGNAWTSGIWVNGRPPGGDAPYFLSVSPGWLDVMRIPLRDGRDFRTGDEYPKVALVNEAFARHYFAGQSPVGRSFEAHRNKEVTLTRIVGLVGDARYRDMRERVRPAVYVPYRSNGDNGGLRPQEWGTFVVRTAGDPLTLASMLRAEIPRVRSEFRVSTIRTQRELVDQHTVRERLLAGLSVFFGILALVLAGIGLYGVLYFSVVQRRREIGIRMALGARARHIAGGITADVFVMFLLGAACGLTAGIASESYVRALLYEVKATDSTVLLWPTLVILGVALLASAPPLWRALRLDPAQTLHAE